MLIKAWIQIVSIDDDRAQVQYDEVPSHLSRQISSGYRSLTAALNTLTTKGWSVESISTVSLVQPNSSHKVSTVVMMSQEYETTAEGGAVPDVEL